MKCLVISILLLICFNWGYAQLSPGDLSKHHAHLEGLSNCTKCHVLGKNVSSEKCLDCHKELKSRINQNLGFHSSSEVKGKECVKCHSDHHGKRFQLIRIDENKFDHTATGYRLEGKHNRLQCKDCHLQKNIKKLEIRKKNYTYLGLEKDCMNCHFDTHDKTLNRDCLLCHNMEGFKPAVHFKHESTQFHLKGKHSRVDCEKCHLNIRNQEIKLKVFKVAQFSNCVNCHKDVHKNKLGNNCEKCHSEDSFHNIKGISSFDHNQTNYKLIGKHIGLDCKKCHKTKVTDPVKHSLCMDCHKDYHEGQFSINKFTFDCSECHNTFGFESSTYTIEDHKISKFPLKGAHLAIPCFVCHKKEDNWEFRKIGKVCVDCHEDIHKQKIDLKYYPKSECRSCHKESRWAEINFDHSTTTFKLEGKHKNQTCRACHFIKTTEGDAIQRFSSLTNQCIDCHQDIHLKQFDRNGITDCFKCHSFDDWKASKFNHNNCKFPLDGKHKNLACNKCHIKTQNGNKTFVQYKLNKFKCKSCH